MAARPGPQRRQAQAGVTLVEILIVLSIIAITTGAVMLRLGLGKSDDALTSAAQTMALAVTQASDAALSSGKDRVLEFGALGYSLHSMDAATAWTPLPGLTLTRSDAVAGPLRLSADGTSVPFGLILTQDSRSITVAFDGLRASRGDVTP